MCWRKMQKCSAFNAGENNHLNNLQSNKYVDNCTINLNKISKFYGSTLSIFGFNIQRVLFADVVRLEP